MEDASALKKIRAFFPLMIVPGIVLLLAPSTVHAVMKDFGFRESLGGLLQVAYFAGGLVGILLITHFMQKVSVKRLILSQVALLSVSLLAASVCPWYHLVLLFLVIAGFANGILITLPGVYVTGVFPRSSHRAQTMLYSFFSLGVVTGPIISGLIINNGHSWRWSFAVAALMILPLTVPIALARLERIEGIEKLSPTVFRQVLAFNRRLFFGLLIALLLYIAAESALSMWMITFLEDKHGASAAAAHWVLTGLWVGITVGRWICGYLSRKIDPYRILIFISISSAVLILITPLTGSRTAIIIMYPLVGLFFAGIYPFLIGYAALFPHEYSSAVFTVFLAAGAAGGATLPYFVGLVNQFGGLALGMSSIALPVLGVIVCLYWLKAHVAIDGESALLPAGE